MTKNGNTAGRLDHICRYFPEYTEVLLAFVLFTFSVITLLPSFLLPAGSVYPAYWVKFLFGLIMLMPSVGLLIIRFRSNIHEYIYNRIRLRKLFLFGISFNFFYLTALRVGISLWPPGLVICLATLLILSIILYLRVSR